MNCNVAPPLCIEQTYCIEKVVSRRKRKKCTRGTIQSNLITIKTVPIEHNHTKLCKMAFLNPWSVNNKFTAVYDFIDDNELDLLAVAESFLKNKENNKPQRVYQHEMFPSSHEMICIPRPGDRKGGGIAIIYKKKF